MEMILIPAPLRCRWAGGREVFVPVLGVVPDGSANLTSPRLFDHLACALIFEPEQCGSHGNECQASPASFRTHSRKPTSLPNELLADEKRTKSGAEALRIPVENRADSKLILYYEQLTKNTLHIAFQLCSWQCI